MTRGMVCEMITPPVRRLMPWMSCLNLRSCFGSFFFHYHSQMSNMRILALHLSFYFPPWSLARQLTRNVVEKKSLDWFLAFIDLPSRTRKRRTAVRALAFFSCGHNLLLTKLLPCCVVWHHPHPTNPTHIGNLFLGNRAFFSFDILRVSLRPRALLEEGPTHGWSWAQGHFW